MTEPDPQSAPQVPLPNLRTLLGRGCRKRCPQCGQGPLYQGWIKLHEHCPVCGLRYLPDQGDLWGALLFFDRILFIVPVIAIFFLRQFDFHTTSLLLLGGSLVFVLIYTLPHRNGMSLALDYLLRRKGGDLSDEARLK